MDKMDKNSGNKRQRLYRYGSNYALSKLIANDGFKNPRRMETPDSSEFSHYNRSSGTRSMKGRVYTDLNIANITEINRILVSFTDHYNAISLDRLSSETKFGKPYWQFNNSLLCKLEFSATAKNLLFLLKIHRKTFFS